MNFYLQYIKGLFCSPYGCRWCPLYRWCCVLLLMPVYRWCCVLLLMSVYRCALSLMPTLPLVLCAIADASLPLCAVADAHFTVGVVCYCWCPLYHWCCVLLLMPVYLCVLLLMPTLPFCAIADVSLPLWAVADAHFIVVCCCWCSLFPPLPPFHILSIPTFPICRRQQNSRQSSSGNFIFLGWGPYVCMYAQTTPTTRVASK